jgi:hypothetical protein
MAISRWIFRLSDGQYLRGGFYDPDFDAATEALDEFPDADPHPDVRLHKGPGRQLRSQAELDAYDLAQRTMLATREQAVKAIRVTMLWVLRRILGRAPTPAEIQQARDEWLAIWDQVP